VILDHDTLPGDADGFPEQDLRVCRVVQYVHEHDDVVAAVARRKALPVETGHRDVGARAHQHVDPLDRHVRPLFHDQLGEQPVSAADVQDARTLWDEPGQLLGQHQNPPAVH
jgi:hypothetical protein